MDPILVGEMPIAAERLISQIVQDQPSPDFDSLFGYATPNCDKIVLLRRSIPLQGIAWRNSYAVWQDFVN